MALKDFALGDKSVQAFNVFENVVYVSNTYFLTIAYLKYIFYHYLVL